MWGSFTEAQTLLTAMPLPFLPLGAESGLFLTVWCAYCFAPLDRAGQQQALHQHCQINDESNAIVQVRVQQRGAIQYL